MNQPRPPPRARRTTATPPQNDAGTQRLAKRVAQQVPCSRSEAEQYIQGGWVSVNGVVQEEPQFRVLDHTAVVIDPNASLLNVSAITIVLHKPAGLSVDKARALLSVANHCPHDDAGIRLLKRHFTDLDCSVPMENGASGLLVFTQDWRTERKLTEDMDAMEHELTVDVQGEISPEALHKITRALNDERKPLPHAKVSVNSASPERSKLRFAVKGAHPGLAAHLCGLAELDILAMRRIRLGRVTLSDLPVGQWRYLAAHERF
jgi:23S rRNA pseudouridine2604 synthase